MPEKVPHRGCLAVCSRGSLGLITSDAPVPIRLHDNKSYIGWSGVQVSPSALSFTQAGRVIGDLWCSRNPKVVLTADELRQMADKAK